MRKAIAIDFDGCLCEEAYPAIGTPHWDVISRAKAEQEAGAGLILWTIREGELLHEAVDACAEWGLHFDAVNTSLQEWKEHYHNDPRKVGATEYWDDRAIQMPDHNPPLTLEELREMDGEPVYVECLFNKDLSAYVVIERSKNGIFTKLFFADFDYYGDEWLAYRRKPEEARHEP